MEAKLMDKEVLCILDTRQIQRFMFKSTSMLEMLGGGDFMKHVQMDAITYALQHAEPALTEKNYALSLDPEEQIPWFESPDIQFQLIMCAAGNALCLVRTGRLCQQLIRSMSRYYLEHGYSLNLTAAAVEKTENLGHDMYEMYKKLNEIKASCDISEPLEPLSVIVREKRTGEPAVGRDANGEYYSKASELKRKEAALRKNIVDYADMQTTKGCDGREYLAVLHADGNNLGITIGRVMQKTPSYDTGIRLRRIINHVIQDVYGQAIDKTFAELKAYWETTPGHEEKPFEYFFSEIHRGGDDLNLICDASLVLPFLDRFYRNLKGLALWQSEEFTAPLYVCTGIAFVTKDTDFHSAFNMASECCARAKAAAKRKEHLRNGFAGNWIDFQVCPEPKTQSLDTIRERSFVTRSGRNLILRPYCMDAEAQDKPYAWEKLLERMVKLRRMNLTEKQMGMIHQAYMAGGAGFRQWVNEMKRKGMDLVSVLGEATDKNEEGKLSYTWLDAAELSGFLSDEG